MCPGCGIATDAPPVPVAADESASAGGWVVGLVLAQGLYYALRHLANAWLLAQGDKVTEAGFWDDRFAGLLTAQGLQAAALFAGGMLAAAGRRRGWAIGASLGLVNALLLIGLQVAMLRQPDEITLYATPLLHAFVGAVAGIVGSRVWQPVPELPSLVGDGRIGREVLTTVVPEWTTEVIIEPVPWLRVFAGIAVAVGGTICAKVIRDFVSVAGTGTTQGLMQSGFITWEITLVAQIIGGAIAGAGSRSAAVYGSWVGVAAAVMLGMLQATAAGITATVPSWLLGASLPEGTPAAVVISSAQALLMALLGGWLGGLILPADPRSRPAAPR
jgi:hypothetical protein